MIDKVHVSPYALPTSNQQDSIPTMKTDVETLSATVQGQIKPVLGTDNIEKDKEKLEMIVSSINELMKPSYTSLKFELHEKLDTYYVKVIDDITKEVVREIPSKKMLDMYAAMKEFVGLMVDKKI